MTAREKLRIRTAGHDDIPAMKSLYRETIRTINAADYAPEQVAAWSGTIERNDALTRRIETQFFYVAVSENDEILGFASFEMPDHLDMMYVHKNHQRRGIGTALLRKILETAESLHVRRIVSRVSITAKPFFERHGFHIVEEKTVTIGDVALTNFEMERAR